MRTLLCILALLLNSAEYLPPRDRGYGPSPLATTILLGSIYSTVPVAPIRAQLFTASGTWICPAGVTKAYLTGCAAGGGGGGPSTGNFFPGGGGGGGDAIIRKDVVVVPGTSYAVTIPGPAAGSAPGNPPAAATAGGNTIFGALLTLVGGAGAVGGGNVVGGGAQGGVGAYDGEDGQAVANSNFGGRGGGNLLSSAPTGQGASIAVTRGSYGVGGGGSNSVAGLNGAAGTQGILLVEW